ncbi:MAG: cation:proton antiporter [Thermoproteales archaeon]|nr:cation:proton antiporter [Thermoproteales archaeon]
MIEDILAIALLIFLAKMLEDVLIRLKQPSLLGWVISGILLGPGFLGIITPDKEILFLTSIGIYLFFFIIGLEEIDIDGIFSSLNRRYIFVSLLSLLLQLVLTVVIVELFQIDIFQALTIGVISAVPTASVVAKVLSDMNVLKTKSGLQSFSYALIGEIFGLILTGTLLEIGVTKSFNITLIVINFIKVGFYFVLAGFLSVFVIPKIIHVTRLYLVSSEALVGIILGLLLFFVGIGSHLGVHGVIGALILGLALSDIATEDTIKSAVESLKKISNGVFIPIFFASLGLNFSWSFLMSDILLALTIFLLFIPIKFSIHYIMLNIFGIENSKELSISMLARGSVDLAILASLLNYGIISGQLYSLLVFIAILSLLFYPLIAKLSITVSEDVPSKKMPFLPIITRQLLGRIKVREVVRKPLFLYWNDDYEKIISFMEKNDLENIVIVDKQKKPIGIVTLKDLKEEKDIRKVLKPIRIIAKPNDDLFTVLEEIAVVNQPVIPIVDDEGKIIGEISLQDIISYMVAKKK